MQQTSLHKAIEMAKSNCFDKHYKKYTNRIENHFNKIGVIMEGWNLHAIKEFGEVFTGTTPSTKKQEYYGGQYKFISPADLDNGKYISTSHKLLTELGLSVSRILPKNAILVGCIGNIGKMGMTGDEKSAFNQQINAIVCNKNHDPDFIYYLLTYNRPVLEKSAVKTTLPILNKGNFQEIKLHAPNLPEQRKIAHVLSTVQKAIEQQDNLIRTTNELKKALMQKLFTEGTRGEPQKQTEIGLVPGSWEVVEMGKTVDFKTGKLNSNAAVENGIYPFFTCSQETFAINNYAFDQEAILVVTNRI